MINAIRIRLSSYDAANLTSLSNGEAADHYERVVQALYPDATITQHDGQLDRVLVTLWDEDGTPSVDFRTEQAILDACREAIGAEWERLTIEHPYDGEA